MGHHTGGAGRGQVKQVSQKASEASGDDCQSRPEIGSSQLRVASVFSARVLLVAARLYPRSSSASEDRHDIFPAHLCVHRVCVHLWHLRLLPPAVAMLQARASALSQGHDGQVRPVTGVRCPACGLLKRYSTDMVAHIRDEHWLPDGRFRRRHFTEAMLIRRIDVLVPER